MASRNLSALLLTVVVGVPSVLAGAPVHISPATAIDTTAISFPSTDAVAGFPLELLDSTPTQGRAGPPPLRVLFLGNSFTFVNTMPAIFLGFMASRHQPCVVGMVTRSGASLHQLWNDGRARTVLQRYPWNVVVLQEIPGETAERFLSVAQRFSQASATKHAQVVLSPAHPMPAWSPAEQQAWEATTATVADSIHAKIASAIPAAWRAALAADSSLPLYLADHSHPSALGAYLNAAVMYQVLTGQSPLGLPRQAGPATLSVHEADLLQRAALKAVTSPANGQRP